MSPTMFSPTGMEKGVRPVVEMACKLLATKNGDPLASKKNKFFFVQTTPATEDVFKTFLRGMGVKYTEFEA